MRSFKWGRVLSLALGMAAAAIGSAAAHATTFNISSAEIDPVMGGVITDIHFAGLAKGSELISVGRLQLSGSNQAGAAVTFDTYCVDLIDTLKTGAFTSAVLPSLPYNTVQLTDLTTFLTHVDPLVQTKVQSAAAQLGAWEILNETPGTGWDVTSGAFSVTGAGNVTKSATLANSWLTQLSINNWQRNPGTTLALLTPGVGNQAQVRVAPGINSVRAVPEPGTWAMTLTGFAFAGIMLRGSRRREESHELA